MKQYQKLDHTYEFDETINKYNSSNLVYNSKHSFYRYYNNKKFNILPIDLKCPILLLFLVDLNKLSNVIPQKENTKQKKETLK